MPTQLQALGDDVWSQIKTNYVPPTVDVADAATSDATTSPSLEPVTQNAEKATFSNNFKALNNTKIELKRNQRPTQNSSWLTLASLPLGIYITGNFILKFPESD